MSSKKITCFISYSHDEANTKKFNKINELICNSNNCINYTERKDKSEFSDATIWNYLHGRISGSSCTIVLLTDDLMTWNRHKIGYKLGDFLGSGWIYNEISASLRDRKDNRINGLVCVVDDEWWDRINLKKSKNGPGFSTWNLKYDLLNLKHDLPEILAKNEEYIIFTRYSNFISDHLKYIQQAIDNRDKQMNSNGTHFQIKWNLHNGTKLSWW